MHVVQLEIENGNLLNDNRQLKNYIIEREHRYNTQYEELAYLQIELEEQKVLSEEQIERLK